MISELYVNKLSIQKVILTGYSETVTRFLWLKRKKVVYPSIRIYFKNGEYWEETYRTEEDMIKEHNKLLEEINSNKVLIKLGDLEK